MFKTGNYAVAKERIKKINTKDNFYDKVRDIVGFYEGVFWEDYEIKNLQRIADARYAEL